jgi:hypothetical protein
MTIRENLRLRRHVITSERAVEERPDSIFMPFRGEKDHLRRGICNSPKRKFLDIRRSFCERPPRLARCPRRFQPRKGNDISADHFGGPIVN